MLGIIIFLMIVILSFTYRTLNFRKKLNEKLDEKVQDKTKELRQSNDQLIESKKELDSFLYRIYVRYSQILKFEYVPVENKPASTHLSARHTESVLSASPQFLKISPPSHLSICSAQNLMRVCDAFDHGDHCILCLSIS